MPRYARQRAPGALVHVICRIVNREFRIAGDVERTALLARIPTALSRADWRMHAFALMSNHIHLAMTAGNAPPEAFLKPLLTAVARYLNQAATRFGPVFGDRATTVVMPRDRMASLTAYIHNNPVRASVVSMPSDTDWSSHRIWTGRDAAPSWLDVETGLRCAGFDATIDGRRAFDDFVSDRISDPRDPDWSERLRLTRRNLRRKTGIPLEISAPTASTRVGMDGHVDLMHVGRPPVDARWDGDLERLVDVVSRCCEVPLVEIRSRTHRPRAVRARRLVVVTGAWLLRRPMNELAAMLTISAPAASRLLHRAKDVLDEAKRVAAQVRTEAAIS